MSSNLLITGESGVGKSTALAEAAELLVPRTISGFLSPRLSEDESNPGWMIEGFTGISGTVVHRSLPGDHRLGSLGVDLKLFEQCVTSAAESFEISDLVMIDEIGIIGSWSEIFREFVLSALESKIPVVAIVRQNSGEFSDSIKQRNDIDLLTATKMNRDSIAGDITRWVETHDSIAR